MRFPLGDIYETSNPTPMNATIVITLCKSTVRVLLRTMAKDMKLSNGSIMAAVGATQASVSANTMLLLETMDGSTIIICLVLDLDSNRNSDDDGCTTVKALAALASSSSRAQP